MNIFSCNVHFRYYNGWSIWASSELCSQFFLLSEKILLLGMKIFFLFQKHLSATKLGGATELQVNTFKLSQSSSVAAHYSINDFQVHFDLHFAWHQEQWVACYHHHGWSKTIICETHGFVFPWLKHEMCLWTVGYSEKAYTELDLFAKVSKKVGCLGFLAFTSGWDTLHSLVSVKT